MHLFDFCGVVMLGMNNLSASPELLSSFNVDQTTFKLLGNLEICCILTSKCVTATKCFHATHVDR